MNVLVLFEYPALHGGERSLLAVFDALRGADITFTALAPPAGPLTDELRRRGVETLAWPPAGPDALARRRACLAELLRARRFDLLHANSLAMGRLSGPVAAAAGVPSLSHLRDIIGLSRQAVADLNCHRRLLAVSQATRDWHVAQGLAAEKTHVLYNGVDLNQWRPQAASGEVHCELGLPADALLALTIGQIGLRKGQDVLLAAAAALAADWPNLHYLIVGERYSQKDESRQFEAQLRAMGSGALAGRCHFLGVRTDVSRLLREASLLVHPARQEPLGRVLLEASACGLAVAATDVGGAREIFGSAGALLVPPDDPAALAAAIARLAADAALRASLGRAVRARAESLFGVRQAAAGLAEHYQAAISGV